MTHLVAIAVWLAASAPSPQATPDSVVVRGRQVYHEQRCQRCHSIGGEGNRRYPLDGVGSLLTTEALRKWIVAPHEMNPRVRKPRYDKLTTADLNAMVAYLASLKRVEQDP